MPNINTTLPEWVDYINKKLPSNKNLRVKIFREVLIEIIKPLVNGGGSGSATLENVIDNDPQAESLNSVLEILTSNFKFDKEGKLVIEKDSLIELVNSSPIALDNFQIEGKDGVLNMGEGLSALLDNTEIVTKDSEVDIKNAILKLTNNSFKIGDSQEVKIGYDYNNKEFTFKLDNTQAKLKVDENNIYYKVGSGNYEGLISSGKFENDFVVNVEQGNYSPGDTITAGSEVTDVLQNALQQTFVPDLFDPSFSLVNTANNVQIVGDTIGFDLTLNFDRGEIKGKLVGNQWEPNTKQDDRAGAATKYTIEGDNMQLVDTKSITGHVVTLGDNTFQGDVEYAEGPQPENSLEENYDSPYPAGNSGTQQTSFEGVYPVFANTDDITVMKEQNPISFSANNFVKQLPQETSQDKHSFEIPQAWLDINPITKIFFYSDLIGGFDTQTNLLNTFSQTSIVKQINGSPIDYVKFENTSVEKGATKYKLIF